MQTREKDDSYKLSKTERIVCGLIRQGLSEPEIARELSRSNFTINNHMRRIYAAFDVHSRSMLLVKLFEQERAALPKKPR